MTPSCPSPKLPDTMSGMLAVAVKDARKLPRALYEPQSMRWHSFTPHNTCQVCLAGAVIAGTLKTPRDRTVYPQQLAGDATRKLESLDYIRRGEWLMAFKCFYLRWPKIPAGRLLHHLPTPSDTHFNGWDEFSRHLDSLEAAIPELREIEASEASM